VKHPDQSEDWRQGGFGLYLHWPYCQSKCPYCDFNSHVAASIVETDWQKAYLAEIERLGAETKGRILRSVFLGGGTPSLMSPDLVAAILDQIKRTWPQENAVEITMEANPGSVEAGRLRGFRDAGINRVSIGVQSLRDDDLRRLGRKHSARDARDAIELALSLFPRVSFDLIYARQDQSPDDWRSELSDALQFGTEHLSLYQLTIETGTVFAARHALGQLRGLPDEDRAVALYDITQDLCSAAGLAAYEVSNHAREGAESRHNLIYWQGGDYGGIGPGAHGRLTLGGQRLATEAPRDPGTWLRMAHGGYGEQPRTPLNGQEQALEYLMMGLRLADGISLARLTGLLPMNNVTDALGDLFDWGMIGLSGDRLYATREGRLVLNSVIAQAATDLGLINSNMP
jgi:putative oxygen-independent coproporphyrinogen III oxidase